VAKRLIVTAPKHERNRPAGARGCNCRGEVLLPRIGAIRRPCNIARVEDPNPRRCGKIAAGDAQRGRSLMRAATAKVCAHARVGWIPDDH
jgi:hypothetical protein